ncbi:MAG TPA: cupin domain-containing protein [Rhizomicrobium sp.]|jgi:quercetin dioxygenase-like cupin family protein
MRMALAAVAMFSALATTEGSVATSAPSIASGATPLILEKNEGEKRVWRPIEGAEGWDAVPGPFILKIDPRNGGSSHLVFVTEDVPPGASIPRHRHPGADEILFFQNGKARVTLGGRVRQVRGGATVFVPANTWISATNIGTEPIHGVFVFSAPGFEGFMRAESAPEGQKITRLSKAEDAQLMKEHAHAVIYAGP